MVSILVEEKAASSCKDVSVSLQSQNHKNLLDVIDRLRSKGISRYVDLPQIIVCGDQSSGKSSVLEAISGQSFPTKDALCTRFATELILRRHAEVQIKISICPDHKRPDKEKRKLTNFVFSQEGLDIGQIVEDAKAAMGLDGKSGKNFSKDVLRVEISGPTQPHLTIVDLPGLFSASDQNQSAFDAKLVERLVLGYMKKQRSIVLAVVSAKNEFALQQVTEIARNVDPSGTRTLGLITKPDTLEKESDSERFYVDLAEGKNVKFRLGWHVLRNRSFTERHSSSADRDATEAKFFSEGIWTRLRPYQLGIFALRTRLSNVLRDQILAQLPSFLGDVQAGLDECRLRTQQLGASRATLVEQRRYLVRTSGTFHRLVSAAINGEYTDVFFRDSPDTEISQRLRAVIQQNLTDFSAEIRQKGHALEILEDGDSEKAPLPSRKHKRMPEILSRSEYMDQVKQLMQKSRGRELPGTFNPLVVSEMFAEQCAPWANLTVRMLETTTANAERALWLILQHVASEEIAESLLARVINPAMESIKEKLKDKLGEILAPHISIHPITYNPDLTEQIQATRTNRLKRKLAEVLDDNLGTSHPGIHGQVRYFVSPRAILDSLEEGIKTDMNHNACSLAVDTMQAYYKVALNQFVDDISSLAIEQCLLQKLPLIFNPDSVFDLDDEEVQRIAKESSDTAAERVAINEKRQVLEAALKELKQLRKLHTQRPSQVASSSARATPMER